jgi:hypothetical protein
MIKIYGSSDDLFEVDGEFRGENEYGCYNEKVVLCVHDFTDNSGVIVTGEYAPESPCTAVWAITVAPEDEDSPMPMMTIEMAENGYSPMLVIRCTDNTSVTKLEATNE